MKISSEHINNLLAYARERHGAPCRVELEDAPDWAKAICGFDAKCQIYYRDLCDNATEPIEQALI